MMADEIAVQGNTKGGYSPNPSREVTQHHVVAARMSMLLNALKKVKAAPAPMINTSLQQLLECVDNEIKSAEHSLKQTKVLISYPPHTKFYRTLIGVFNPA
jgi:hypothetical protein